MALGRMDEPSGDRAWRQRPWVSCPGPTRSVLGEPATGPSDQSNYCRNLPEGRRAMQPWRLDELNYGEVKTNLPYEVAVLPLGATEPHNLHLPYGTDTFQVEVIASKACALAAKEGARVLLLPSLPYGTETNQMKFPLAMN